MKKKLNEKLTRKRCGLQWAVVVVVAAIQTMLIPRWMISLVEECAAKEREAAAEIDREAAAETGREAAGVVAGIAVGVEDAAEAAAGIAEDEIEAIAEVAEAEVGAPHVVKGEARPRRSSRFATTASCAQSELGGLRCWCR